MESGLLDQCAQHPINWYSMDRQMQQLSSGDRGFQFRFGAKDQQFRSEVAQVFQNYIDTGEDLFGPAKVKLVKQYLPDYVEACMESFEAAIQECSPFLDEATTTRYQACVEKYDADYKFAVEAFTMHELRYNKVVDIGKFNFQYVQKLKRKAQLDPTGSMLGH